MRRLLILLCLLFAFSARAEGFRVQTDGEIISFAENRLLVSAPAAGTLTVTLSDNDLCLRVLSAEVPEGESTICWDGLGAWEERILDGTYTLSASLNGETCSDSVTVGRCRQALLFALPVRETIHTRDEGTWYTELCLVRGGTVMMEVSQGDTLILRRSREVEDENPYRFYWSGRNGDNELPPGVYTLTFYAEKNTDRRISFDVTITNDETPALPVAVTGAVLPQWGDTEEEVWAIMQSPAVVLTGGSAVTHRSVYAAPDKGSEVLGTLHYISQCVEVFSLDGEWAEIGAWNHENAVYIRGYVPQSCLTAVQPDSHYGLLVDKQTQTMTIYEEGRMLATIPVSTGLATDNAPERETAAGSFLTETRIGNFSSGGFRYRYVIRYDGGNLLHSIGYRKVNGRLDFSLQLPLLGQKASHGCVRLPCGDTSLPNAYWLYTHLPPYTRVLILE